MDNRHNVFEGIYYNRVQAVDYYSKSWKNTDFSIVENEKMFKQLGKRLAVDKDWLNTFSNEPQHTHLFFKDTTKPFAMLSTLIYADSFLGRSLVGRIKNL